MFPVIYFNSILGNRSISGLRKVSTDLTDTWGWFCAVLCAVADFSIQRALRFPLVCMSLAILFSGSWAKELLILHSGFLLYSGE